jgi:tetratricopeptide (TPR) repeat protein
MSFRASSAIFLLIFLTASFFSISLRARQSPNAETKLQTLYSQAQRAQSRHDYEEAARDYAGILKLQPRLPEIRANLGIMDHLLGRYSEAVQNFQKALREKPDLLSANLFLGIDLLQLHHAQEALPYLTRADHLAPRNVQVNLSLARAFADLCEFDEANEYYDRAAAIDPQNAAAVYGLGITYMSLQQSAVERLAQTGKRSVYGRMLLADSFANEGRWNDSIHVLQDLLKSFPDFPGIHTALGFDEAQRGDLRKSEGEFQIELRVHAGYLPARLGLARVALSEGNPQAAAADLEQAWQADSGFVQANIASILSSPDLQEAAALRARLATLTRSLPASHLRDFLNHFLAKSPEQATTLTSQVPNAFAQPPSRAVSARYHGAQDAQRLFADGHYTACAESLQGSKKPLGRSQVALLAECSYYAGRYRDSFLAAGELLHREPADKEALYWRAKSCKKLALQSLTMMGIAHPNSYRVHLLLGQVYLNMNRYQQAEGEYAMALAMQPRDLAGHIGLATAYWKDMKFDAALPHLKAALAEDPADPDASYILGEILIERHQYSEAKPHLVVAARGAGDRALLARALLSKVDASQGKTREAIAELKQALSVDHDGSLYFQLYQLYHKQGDIRAAQAALAESQAIRAQSEQSAQDEIQVHQ